MHRDWIMQVAFHAAFIIYTIEDNFSSWLRFTDSWRVIYNIWHNQTFAASHSRGHELLTWYKTAMLETYWDMTNKLPFEIMNN